MGSVPLTHASRQLRSSEARERCETCRFRFPILRLNADGRWDPPVKRDDPGWPEGGETEAEYEERTNEGSGECRRFPPASGKGWFVLVELNTWCGEWQAKPEE